MVARQQPDDLLVKLNLALCCSRLMTAQPSDRYYQEAVVLFEQAVSRLLALTPRYPQDNWSQVVLLETYCSLALGHWKATREELADRIFQDRVWALVDQLNEYQANHGQRFDWLDHLLRAADLLCKKQPRTALGIVRKTASLVDRYADGPSRDLPFCVDLARRSTHISAVVRSSAR